MVIIIRGAGDIASGIAARLIRSGMPVIMTDLARPTSIRRTVCFSEAILYGEAKVEDLAARFAATPEEALEISRSGVIAVLADEDVDFHLVSVLKILIFSLAVLVFHQMSQASRNAW